MNYETLHLWMHLTLTLRAKLRVFKNDKLLLCLKQLMIKFESYLIINNNNNKSNTAGYNKKLD